ncbi:MAG: nitronate monooxygenase [Syntrophales bacterium]|jgi:nitronate monooxygenase|nr:nitronate monooxygenase [Syntrophales bacterium]MDD4340373.1 nitronate monooxygenase [Syntrophales bacterium]HOG07071.1 nitronate monooxygenase [Syntrophales bacterium]HOS78249.1 nitronate monooxygenase [Syntrophales bacterium]HPB71000.1 nitronate monooxygenase [Syntrophales bacterium]
MLKTRITELLGIQHPVLMGAMHRVTTAEMVAAVAEAGGIGFIPAAAFASLDALRGEIRKARTLTDGPIGLNISLVPAVHPGEKRIREIIEVGVEEGVGAFETAGGSPAAFLPLIKASRIPVLHKVTQVRYARKAEEIGADAVIVIGCEGGGYIGPAEIPTMILVEGAARALSIPVVAAGGIADGRTMAAALTLGAEGVLMGTRFIASTEAGLHARYQERLVETGETDTVVLFRSFGSPLRFIRNRLTPEVERMEREGRSMREILDRIGPGQEKDLRLDDDPQGRLFPVGFGVTLIDRIRPIAEIVAEIVREAETAILCLDRVKGETAAA